jgi:hypothetical protein
MAANTFPQLKHVGFWEKMERAKQQAQNWPQWMKGSPVNRREPKKTAPAVKDPIQVSPSR